MTTTAAKPPVLVVIQLTGGLDFLNTVIPYQNGIIRDARPTVSVPAEDTLPLNDQLAWNPALGPLKELYDAGNVAVVQGVGWEHQGGPGSDRSHFRAMDIWHTCTPAKISTEGWLARLTREFDPAGENPCHGRQLRPRIAPRAGRAGRHRHLDRLARPLRSDDRDRAGARAGQGP